MRKNGSRLISFSQYRLTDLFLFAVILVVFELVLHYAMASFSNSFTYSPLVPIVLLVMMRWGWPCIFYAVGDALLYCVLNGLGWQYYVIFCIGNSFIMLLLLMTKFLGKQRIAGKWYLSALFVFAGWIAVYLGRAVVSEICGLGFVYAIVGQLWELLSLAIGIVLILVLRRFDGMFEDQKHFLLRLDREKKDLQRRDDFGDEPLDIDEESLSILKKNYED